MNLKITVTAKDIKGVKRKTYGAHNCPVAKACKRLGYPDVLVEYGYIRFHIGGSDVSVPRKTKNWIRIFDNGEPVKPFSFTVKNAPKPRSI